MRRAAVVAAILLLAHGAGAQQCEGDFNGDGQVMINEIILTVNNSLNGCVTGLVCPIDFADDNTAAGTPDCYYVGRWNMTCGGADLETRFISDLGDMADPTDDLVLVELVGFTPRLFYGATTTSPTSADLIGWFTEPANPNDPPVVHNAPGTLQLTTSRTLVIAPNAVPFQIESCDFVRYEGSLTDVVQPPAQGAAAGVRIDPAVFEHFRAARSVRPPRPNLKRQ
jgi:hypothetical protein